MKWILQRNCTSVERRQDSRVPVEGLCLQTFWSREEQRKKTTEVSSSVFLKTRNFLNLYLSRYLAWFLVRFWWYQELFYFLLNYDLVVTFKIFCQCDLKISFPHFQLQMIVVISGDCNTNHCNLTGLDIFAVRHPKLFNLVISRLGLVTDGSEQVGKCLVMSGA